MRRQHRSLRAPTLLAVFAMLATMMAGIASAEPYEPPVWNPPAGQNVSEIRSGPITIPAAPESTNEECGHGGHNEGCPVGEIKNQIAVDGACNPLINLYGWLSGGKTSCVSTSFKKPCEDCYITGILPDMVKKGTDESVNMHNGGMLHHAVLMNFNRPDATCAPRMDLAGLLTDRALINNLGFAMGGNQRMFAAGNERTIGQIDASGNYGYYLKKGDKLGLIYHLMNLHAHPLDIEFKFTVTWVKSATPVEPVWLDVDQCNDSELDIPAGYSDVEWTGTMPYSGTLVGVGGHAHNHSIAVSLENVTKNRFSCTSVAGYAAGSEFLPTAPGPGTPGHPANANIVSRTGHPGTKLEQYMGTVSNFSTCAPNDRWDQGDKMRIHTTYQHPEGDDHAMGIMVGYVKR